MLFDTLPGGLQQSPAIKIFYLLKNEAWSQYERDSERQTILKLQTWDKDMVQIQPMVTPIELMMEMCVSEQEHLDLQRVIRRANKLPLGLQLDALSMNTVSAMDDIESNAEQHYMMTNLIACPDGLATTKEIVRIYSILNTFLQQRIALKQLVSEMWNEKQVPLSFLMFSVKRLQHKPVDDEDRNELQMDLECADATWLFIHHLLRFCTEQKWDGKRLHAFWNEATGNGIKINAFGVKLVENILSSDVSNGSDNELYKRTAELLNMWYYNVLQTASKSSGSVESAALKANDDQKEEHSLSIRFPLTVDEDEDRNYENQIVRYVQSRDMELLNDLPPMTSMQSFFNLNLVQRETVVLSLLRSISKNLPSVLTVHVQDEMAPVGAPLNNSLDLSVIFRRGLWSGTNTKVDKPLFLWSPTEIWWYLGRWVSSDVKYKLYLKALQEKFEEYNVSGSVVNVFHQNDNMALIESILKEQTKGYLLPSCLELISHEFQKWIEEVSEDEDIKKSFENLTPEQVAEMLLEFPLQRLKMMIIDENLSGKTFCENPEVFGIYLQNATGWSQLECSQISTKLSSNISFTKEQLLKSLRTNAFQNGLSNSLVKHMETRLLFECDLETMHYELRTKGYLKNDFRDLVLEFARDAAKQQESGPERDRFISNYFKTVSNALIMRADDDGENYRPWKCIFCGHFNANMVAGHELVRDMSNCIVCGYAQTELLTMTIKGFPMLIHINSEKDRKKSVDDHKEMDLNEHEEVILRNLKNKRLDLHCPTQIESDLCESLKMILVILREHHRFVEDGEAPKDAKQIWTEQLDTVIINGAYDHIKEYHLESSFRPKCQVIQSFCKKVVQCENAGDCTLLKMANEVKNNDFSDGEVAVCNIHVHLCHGQMREDSNSESAMQLNVEDEVKDGQVPNESAKSDEKTNVTQEPMVDSLELDHSVSSDEFKNKKEYIDAIERYAEEHRGDLTCQLTDNSLICESMKFIAVILLEHKQYLKVMQEDQDANGTEIDVNALEMFVTEKMYREWLLGAADVILSENHVNLRESVLETLRKLLDENTDDICNFVFLWGGKGQRKAFLNTMKKYLKNKKLGGPLGKIYKKVREEMNQYLKSSAPKYYKQQYQQWLQQLDANEVANHCEHIDRAHLPKSDAARRSTVYAFFEDVVHSADSEPDKSKCLHSKMSARNEQDDSLKSMLNNVHLDWCHHRESELGKFWRFITYRDDLYEYGFGIRQNHIHLTPKFGSIREEVECNSAFPISHDAFIGFLTKAIAKMGKVSKMYCREHASKHGFIRNDKMAVKHVLAMILYTDHTKFSKFCHLGFCTQIGSNLVNSLQPLPGTSANVSENSWRRWCQSRNGTT